MIRRELFKFKGLDFLPHYWRPYFSMSEVGKTYEILYNNKDKNGCNLIMSNTEYEYLTNQRFFDKIREGDEILSIGYGIGLIIPEVKRKGGKLTIIEKYQEVINLEKKLDTEIDIVIGDVNEIKFNETFNGHKFDLIFSDTSETNHQKDSLENLLKDDGQLVFWEHIKIS